MKFSFFSGEKNLCILHGQVFVMIHVVAQNWCVLGWNIRILHECQVWIDKSVLRVTFWHHEACQVMPNCDQRDRFVYPYLTRMMDSFSCFDIIVTCALSDEIT